MARVIQAAGRGWPAVALDDGTVLAADLLVLCCGTRPRTELARAAGPRRRRGHRGGRPAAQRHRPGRLRHRRLRRAPTAASAGLSRRPGRRRGSPPRPVAQPAVPDARAIPACRRHQLCGSPAVVRLKAAGIELAALGIGPRGGDRRGGGAGSPTRRAASTRSSWCATAGWPARSCSATPGPRARSPSCSTGARRCPPTGRRCSSPAAALPPPVAADAESRRHPRARHHLPVQRGHQGRHLRRVAAAAPRTPARCRRAHPRHHRLRDLPGRRRGHRGLAGRGGARPTSPPDAHDSASCTPHSVRPYAFRGRNAARTLRLTRAGQAGSMSDHLVVAGNGMVGQRLVEALRDTDAAAPLAGHRARRRNRAAPTTG